MKIMSVFNNKGGVGKSTLAYHTAWALSELGKRVLMIDMDPQCNLSLYGCSVEDLHGIWEKEDDFIDEGFDISCEKIGKQGYERLINEPRTIHFLLKPTEDGTGEINEYPEPVKLNDNLFLVPGRLTLHTFEDMLSSRWNDVYNDSGNILAIRTITQIRTIALKYSKQLNIDYVIIDTSPSLGRMNKAIISTVDGFIIPASPDMFSLYGIRNIGNALLKWRDDFEVIYKLISAEKLKKFPDRFVQFIGYTIYNAKRNKAKSNNWGIAQAHYNYAKQMPGTIKEYIPPELRKYLNDEMIDAPIGQTSIMLTHNTYPASAQKYRCPMWKVPNMDLDNDDINTILGNRQRYYDTQSMYHNFANDLLSRIEML